MRQSRFNLAAHLAFVGMLLATSGCANREREAEIARIKESVPGDDDRIRDAIARKTSAEWRSIFYPILIKLAEGWEIVRPSRDEAEGVTVAAVNRSTRCSLVIKVTRDVGVDLVSDDQYYEAVRNQMINHAEGNRLIDEVDVQYKNTTYHRMRFEMVNHVFNESFCQALYTRRTGEVAVAFQVNYPISSPTELDVPAELDSFLEGVELFSEQ